MDAELELKKAEDELEIIKKEILDAIAKIGDYECEIALIYRYIKWLSWKEISKSLFCSSTTARRIHDKALELFVVPEK